MAALPSDSPSLTTALSSDLYGCNKCLVDTMGEIEH